MRKDSVVKMLMGLSLKENGKGRANESGTELRVGNAIKRMSHPVSRRGPICLMVFKLSAHSMDPLYRGLKTADSLGFHPDMLK